MFAELVKRLYIGVSTNIFITPKFKYSLAGMSPHTVSACLIAAF